MYPEGSKLSVYLHLLQGYWILKNREIQDKNLTNGKIYADFVIFPSQIAPKIFLKGNFTEKMTPFFIILDDAPKS